MTKQEALEQIDKLKAYVECIKDTDKERDEWFLSVLNGLILEIGFNCVRYGNKDRRCIFQDNKDGVIIYSHDRIYRFLIDNYKMGSSEIDKYIKSMLLKHRGWKVTDVVCSINHPYFFGQGRTVKH